MIFIRQIWGREAAIIDIAQDLLLSYLEDKGFMKGVCLKGGTARDMYDLNWIMENKPLADTLDKNLLRKLVVLKIWVDSYGMHYGNIFYRPAHEPSVFDPDRWLNGRNEKNINEEDIGTLAVPAPSARQMIDGLKENYQFLMDLNDTEKVIALSSQKDRSLVIHELSELPDGRLIGGLY